MAEYNVVLLDRDDCETTNDVVDGLSAAKKRAKYLLSDAYADAVESTHDDLGTVKVKVEVRDGRGECLWDTFR